MGISVPIRFDDRAWNAPRPGDSLGSLTKDDTMQHPKIDLLAGPTPLESLRQLSDHLDIDLWVKRDDMAGTTFGGNKSRQLEFYLGAALAENADTILITGAVQSNFVRTAAASAARLGMRTIVQLEARVAGRDDLYQVSGNVLLNQLMGVEIMHYPEGEDEVGADAALRSRANAERAKGRRPYVIPLALGNPPLGALGYVQAVPEIMAQHSDFDQIVVASGSGLTHAGLLKGLNDRGFSGEVIGSCVRRDAGQQQVRMRQVLDDLQTLMGAGKPVPDSNITLWDGAFAPGYGQIGPEALNAMKTMAAHEGLMLDPVYTAKAFAAILAGVKTGEISKGSKVLFVHSGGLPSLFAYQNDLSQMLDAG